MYRVIFVLMQVRTRPIWVPAGADKVVDGACVSYEFVRSTYDLKSILLSHPFKISSYTRSQSGHDAIGDSYVDLSLLYETTPHSYRSPLDKRAVFNSPDQYSQYRQTLITLHTASRPFPVPPTDPVVIRAIDAFYPITYAPIGGLPRKGNCFRNQNVHENM